MVFKGLWHASLGDFVTYKLRLKGLGHATNKLVLKVLGHERCVRCSIEHW